LAAIRPIGGLFVVGSLAGQDLAHRCLEGKLDVAGFTGGWCRERWDAERLLIYVQVHKAGAQRGQILMVIGEDGLHHDRLECRPQRRGSPLQGWRRGQRRW